MAREFEYDQYVGDPTPEDEAAYINQCRIDDALRDELGERAWFALIYDDGFMAMTYGRAS